MNIYNLYIGPSRPDESLASVRIGPFLIEVVSNYNQIVDTLPQRGMVNKDWGTGVEEYLPPRESGWIHTANCKLIGEPEESVFLHKPDKDGGIWDLCQILTFLNGRYITERPEIGRFNPNDIGERACVDVEILWAAKVMYENRMKIKERKLDMALLLHNLSFGHKDMQSKAMVISAAFNRIYDDWRRQIKKKDDDIKSLQEYLRKYDLSKKEKAILKEQLTATIESIEGLAKEKKEAIGKKVRAKIDNGLVSPVYLVRTMLISENIISDEPTKDEMKRIEFLDTVRNKFVHSGAPPNPKSRRSVEISGFIVCRLLPDFIQMYIGKVVGYTSESVGSLSQYKEDFVSYFRNGVYEGRAVEIDSYTDELRSKFDV